jgi:hypothetical protein
VNELSGRSAPNRCKICGKIEVRLRRFKFGRNQIRMLNNRAINMPTLKIQEIRQKRQKRKGLTRILMKKIIEISV